MIRYLTPKLSGIRVTYSGLVSFVIGLVSVFTGLIFTLIVTRTLTSTEYGAWSLISGLFGYVIVMEPLISYWATREIARGNESGKTVVLSSGILSLGAVICYITIAYFVGQQTHVDQNILFFAAILIPVMFLNRTLTAINLGWKPHAISYGTLCFGIAEIPTSLIFIYFLDMGVAGVIITSLVAYLVSIVILSIYGLDKIKNSFKKEFLSKYLKLFWLPLYPGIASLVYFLDVTIFSIITKSVEGLALWSAAMVVPNMISQSALISRAVYPKLLGEDNNEYLKGNLTQLFYFAIPLTALAITFARPALFALNPIYEKAVPVVIFTSLFVLLNTISGVFQSLLAGIEKVDVNEKSTFKDYIKSKLFFLPTLTLIQYGSYVSLLAIMLILLTPNITLQLDLVIYWSIIALITQIPFTLYLYILVKRNFTLFLDYVSILKYLIISIIVFGLIFVITRSLLNYEKNIFEFITSLLLFVGLAIGSYLGVTYVVDSRTRKLFKSIIEEINSRF